MNLFSQKEAAEFIKTGAKEFRYSRDHTRLTPGARDLLIDKGVKVIYDPSAGAQNTSASAAAPAKSSEPAKSGSAGATASKADITALFNSPLAKKLKEEICEMGSRCWKRDYNDGNGGNISARLGNYFLCTPRGHRRHATRGQCPVETHQRNSFAPRHI